MSGHATHRSSTAASLAVLALSAALASTPVLAEQTEGTAFSWMHDDPDLEWLDCPPFMPEGCGIAVLQGNPTEYNADLFFLLPAGTVAPLHWHTSAERTVLVAGEMHIGFEGEDPVVLEPGTYAYVPAEVPHDASCVSEEDCVLFIAFEEPVDAIPVENPFTSAD